MLSFFPAFPSLLLAAKSCHLLFPASSSRLALTFRGTLAGRMGPSPALLGSLRAWVARAGLISAAAEITLELAGSVCGDTEPDSPSALRFRVSMMGLMSFAVRVSVVPYDLKETM